MLRGNLLNTLRKCKITIVIKTFYKWYKNERKVTEYVKKM